MPGIDDSRPFVPVNIAVLTISDSRDLGSDRSGDTLVQRLTGAGHLLAARAIVKDEVPAIVERLHAWIADDGIEVSVVIPGLGIGGGDILGIAGDAAALVHEVKGVEPLEAGQGQIALGRRWAPAPGPGARSALPRQRNGRLTSALATGRVPTHPRHRVQGAGGQSPLYLLHELRVDGRGRVPPPRRRHAQPRVAGL